MNENSQTPFFSGQSEFNALDLIIHGELQQVVLMGTVKHRLPARFPKLSKWFNMLMDEMPVKANFQKADAYIKTKKYYEVHIEDK